MKWVALLVLSGCVAQVAVRASSTYTLSQEASQLVLPAAPNEVRALLEDLLRDHGMFVIGRYPIKKGAVVYYAFAGEQRRAGKNVMPQIEGHDIGSWFLARIAANDKGSELLLIGKPTLDGHEVCAESDGLFGEINYSCVDQTVRSDFPPEKLPTGREEAEIVRAVLTALRQHYTAH